MMNYAWLAPISVIIRTPKDSNLTKRAKTLKKSMETVILFLTEQCNNGLHSVYLVIDFIDKS